MSRPSAVETDFGEAQQTIEWLMGDEAHSYARGLLRRARLDRELAGDLVNGAVAAMIRWSRGPKARELDNPAAYGSTAVRSQFTRLLRGMPVVETELDESVLSLEVHLHPDHDDDAEMQTNLDDGDAADPLRVGIELQVAPAWVRSAALSFVTLAVHDTGDVADLPSPLSGARSDQALCWPALYLAGHDDLFAANSSDAIRKRRSRYIRQVLDAVNAAFVAAAARGEVQGG